MKRERKTIRYYKLLTDEQIILALYGGRVHQTQNGHQLVACWPHVGMTPYKMEKLGKMTTRVPLPIRNRLRASFGLKPLKHKYDHQETVH